MAKHNIVILFLVKEKKKWNKNHRITYFSIDYNLQ